MEGARCHTAESLCNDNGRQGKKKKCQTFSLSFFFFYNSLFPLFFFELINSMAYPRSSPHSTLSREDWDLKSKMSKTTSTGSTTYSVASASSRLTNASVQESSARVYFIELQRYLSSMLSKGKNKKNYKIVQECQVINLFKQRLQKESHHKEQLHDKSCQG